MKELIEAIEAAKVVNAKTIAGRSANVGLDTAIAIIRQHEARTPQAREVDEERCSFCKSAGETTSRGLCLECSGKGY